MGARAHHRAVRLVASLACARRNGGRPIDAGCVLFRRLRRGPSGPDGRCVRKEFQQATWTATSSNTFVPSADHNFLSPVPPLGPSGETAGTRTDRTAHLVSVGCMRDANTLGYALGPRGTPPPHEAAGAACACRRCMPSWPGSAGLGCRATARSAVRRKDRRGCGPVAGASRPGLRAILRRTLATLIYLSVVAVRILC